MLRKILYNKQPRREASLQRSATTGSLEDFPEVGKQLDDSEYSRTTLWGAEERKVTMGPKVDDILLVDPEYADAGRPGIPSSFNIVLFGEAGVGKSSVINLIADKKIAKTSPDSWGCTLESQQYTFRMARRTFNIWDTVGLQESSFSVTNYLTAIENTHSLIQQITAEGGLDLLLFCIPGSGSRLSQTMLCNYRLFYEVLCRKKIPIALVVTHLESEPHMDEWWDRNGPYFDSCGLKFSGHACVTALPGHEKARESRVALEHLLLSYNWEGRYAMPASEWHVGFLKRLASGFMPRSSNMKDRRKQVERMLVQRCMMAPSVARRLAETLTLDGATAKD